jgi:hypothetical protein
MKIWKFDAKKMLLVEYNTSWRPWRLPGDFLETSWRLLGDFLETSWKWCSQII